MTPRRDFFGSELQDFVGRAADFEGADGLQAFGFEPDFAGIQPGKGARISGVLMAMPAMRAAASRISAMEISDSVSVVMEMWAPASRIDRCMRRFYSQRSRKNLALQSSSGPKLQLGNLQRQQHVLL